MRNIKKIFSIALVLIFLISASTASLAREINIDNYLNLGLGITHNPQNPFYPAVSFSTPGNYTSDPSSNDNSISSEFYNIVVQDSPNEGKILPEANFITNVTGGYVPFSVQFAALSKNATEWKWDFGDGANSTDKNPVHTYSRAGTYNVNLTVTNENGSASKSGDITALDNPAPVLPIADYITNVSSGYVPLSVQFADLSQYATQRSWNFGDGTISTDKNPMHTYSRAGYYIASLTVYNENGTHTKIQDINVQEVTIYPVANFTANVTSGFAPLSVLFTDTSENATSNTWDFNNDRITYRNYSNNVYTYKFPGTYNVTLIVSNKNGTDSKTQVITVLEAPIENKVLPDANFSTNITSGYAPLSVLFTDLSQNATSKIWDFDNNGIWDSNDTNPIWTYTAPGTYIANLTVSNENGTSNKSTFINVLDGNSSGGGSGGDNSGGSDGGSSGGSNDGGSGGNSDSSSRSSNNVGSSAGGSPEPLSNVDGKELSQVFITNERPVEFDFPMNTTSVVNITFNSKKTTGKTTTIVEMLKNKSTLVPFLPSGEIYKFFNIWVGNSGLAAPKNIENLTICFKVEKRWTQDRNINPSSITLQRYSDNKWTQLPTSLQKEDDKYLYLTSEVTGFSYFAITHSVTEEADTNIQPANDVKIQPEARIDQIEQQKIVLNSEQQLEQKSEQKSEQESAQGNIVIILLFGTICMIIPPLLVFFFKIV